MGRSPVTESVGDIDFGDCRRVRREQAQLRPVAALRRKPRSRRATVSRRNNALGLLASRPKRVSPRGRRRTSSKVFERWMVGTSPRRVPATCTKQWRRAHRTSGAAFGATIASNSTWIRCAVAGGRAATSISRRKLLPRKRTGIPTRTDQIRHLSQVHAAVPRIARPDLVYGHLRWRNPAARKGSLRLAAPKKPGFQGVVGSTFFGGHGHRPAEYPLSDLFPAGRASLDNAALTRRDTRSRPWVETVGHTREHRPAAAKWPGQ